MKYQASCTTRVFLSVVFLLSSVSLSVAQQKLRLVLEGPFALCETDDKASLNVLIPNVVGMDAPGQHFTPGIKTYALDRELKKSQDYSIIEDPAPAKPRMMTIQTLKADYPESGKLRDVQLDHIVAHCRNYMDQYYATIKIPKPDTIRPLFPVNAKVYEPSAGNNCNHSPDDKSLFGTSSELTFDSVNLAGLKLRQESGQYSWPLQVDAEDGYLTIYLHPLRPEDPDPTHQRALDSYKEMTRMVNIQRCFKDPDRAFVQLRASVHTSAGHKPAKGKVHPESVHNDCHAPQLLACQQADCR